MATMERERARLEATRASADMRARFDAEPGATLAQLLRRQDSDVRRDRGGRRD